MNTSVSALELHSRAESSLEVMYHSRGPNTWSNPGGRQIIKKQKKVSHGGKLVGHLVQDLVIRAQNPGSVEKIYNLSLILGLNLHCCFLPIITVLGEC